LRGKVDSVKELGPLKLGCGGAASIWKLRWGTSMSIW